MGYVILCVIVLVIAEITLGVARQMTASDDPEAVRAGQIARIATLVMAPLFLVVFTVVESFQRVRAGYVGLRTAGIPVDRIEEREYGRFGWATDAEGNRFELWEPAQ